MTAVMSVAGATGGEKGGEGYRRGGIPEGEEASVRMAASVTAVMSVAVVAGATGGEKR